MGAASLPRRGPLHPAAATCSFPSSIRQVAADTRWPRWWKIVPLPRSGMCRPTGPWRHSDEITILTLATGERRIIRPNNVKNLTDVAWAADGRSLFATTTNIRRAEVFHIALDGTASLLRTFESQVASNPRPSPDGRSLLVGVLQTNANAWVIER